MLIMALDLGKRTGVATGFAGEDMPRIEAVTLRGKADGADVQARNLGCFLRDRWQLPPRPDLVIIESAMNPVASKSADATISQLYCHGALHALAGTFGLRVEVVAAQTARRHFCGAASAAPRRGQPRTAAQQRKDREETNRMVVRRAITLGYLPHGSDDWDKASAAALFDFAAATYARTRPRELVMFGEVANV
jgi:hypothetical protein